MKSKRTPIPDDHGTFDKTAENKAVQPQLFSSVSLFFCVDAASDKKQIEDICRKAEADFKHVEVILLSFDKETAESGDNGRIIFTKKDFNLFGRLKRKAKERFGTEPAPLLIVFPAKERHKQCGRLISALPAKIKAGPGNCFYSDLLNFTVKTQQKKTAGFETFYEQLVYYVKLMGLMNG